MNNKLPLYSYKRCNKKIEITFRNDPQVLVNAFAQKNWADWEELTVTQHFMDATIAPCLMTDVEIHQLQRAIKLS